MGKDYPQSRIDKIMSSFLLNKLDKIAYFDMQ